jgi:hypothetical protein
MNFMTIRFWFRCSVILATTAVLGLAMIQLGSGSEQDSTGACAAVQERYAQVSLLQPAGWAFALTDRLCSL